MDDDVIGSALLDYHNKNYSSDIIVKSSISEDDIISLPYLFRTEKELPELESLALNLCKGKVLDVGAGSGCHSIILKNRDFDVIAIDTSKGAAEVMQNKGLNAKNINFYDAKDKYDTLLLLMNGAGIAGELSNLKHFLEKGKSLLNDGGQMLLDSSDIKYMFEEEDGSFWVDLNRTYYGEVTYQMEYKDLKTGKFEWLFVDYETLKAVAIEVGFRAELIYEDDNNQYLTKLSI